MDGIANWAPWVVAAVVAVGLVLRARFHHVTALETLHVVRYRDGILVGELAAGRHLLHRQRDTIVTAPRQPVLLTLPGQEVLTADGVPVKVSLLATVRVTDAVTALHVTQSWHDSTYAALQVALRGAISSVGVDDVLGDRDQLGASTGAAAADAVAAVGVALEDVRIKDLMLPGPVRDLFARVVSARKEGEARLERVRAETAAMRSLANAARLVEDQPVLLQLRAVTGADQVTVVLGGDTVDRPQSGTRG